MKIVLCVHGFPPELNGGTEVSAHRLAMGLARGGHHVIVVAGSCEQAQANELVIRPSEVPVAGEGSLRIERWTRPDLYFDHWHKSKSARVGTAFRALLRREKPDLVHVLHWLRLTRDLVQIAAQEGVRAVLSLGDSFISCPLTFRVKPQSGQACGDPLAAMGCIRCAAQILPKTPWVPLEAAFLELGMRTAALAAELDLACACLVPTAGFGQRQLKALASEGVSFEFQTLAPCGTPEEWKRRSTILEQRPLRIGAWGALSDLKGTDLLFEAVAGLDDPKQVELELAGVEQQSGYVDRLRERFPAVSVRYSGPYQVHELPTHAVTQVHLMVSASRAPESFGIVLEEARALGLPSLLPAHGAFSERSAEGLGSVLFIPADSVSLGATLQGLLDKPQLLNQLTDQLPAALGQEQVLAEHVALYEQVLANSAIPQTPAHEWYAERMAIFAEEQWDRSLSACSAQQLGFDSEPQS